MHSALQGFLIINSDMRTSSRWTGCNVVINLSNTLTYTDSQTFKLPPNYIFNVNYWLLWFSTFLSIFRDSIITYSKYPKRLSVCLTKNTSPSFTTFPSSLESLSWDVLVLKSPRRALVRHSLGTHSVLIQYSFGTPEYPPSPQYSQGARDGGEYRRRPDPEIVHAPNLGCTRFQS